jgi:hypothetical protein
MSRGGAILLIFFVPLLCIATGVGQSTAAEPKTSVEWFKRAEDRMNLRTPGAAPFRTKVTFHAFPGIEFLNLKEKPQIVTGDGVYEETWLSPHEWRREVTLANYHAVEEGSGGVRKMQASSDYEPSRVLMLLNALLNTIPRNFASKEFQMEGASGWKIGHVTVGSLTLVSVSKGTGSERADYSDTFYFLPLGLVVLRNENGVTTGWENDVAFAGKAVPGHLTIKAGERELLTADISIVAAGAVDTATFDLPGRPADPGMTLRPLQKYELRFPDNLADNYAWTKPGRDTTVFLASIWGVLDRHGKYRELELVVMPNEKSVGAQEDMRILMTHMREEHRRSPEIDGSPAEYVIKWRAM